MVYFKENYRFQRGGPTFSRGGGGGGSTSHENLKNFGSFQGGPAPCPHPLETAHVFTNR